LTKSFSLLQTFEEYSVSAELCNYDIGYLTCGQTMDREKM